MDRILLLSDNSDSNSIHCGCKQIHLFRRVLFLLLLSSSSPISDANFGSFGIVTCPTNETFE